LNEPKKQRTPAERHDAWIAWRKRGVAEYGDVCGCRIGLSEIEQHAATKCCRTCTGCNQRIKKDLVRAHQSACKAFQDLERFVATLKAGDEFVQLSQSPDEILGGHWSRCFYCRKPIRQRLEEWHWRNNCDGLKQKQEAEYIAGVHATERARGSDDEHHWPEEDGEAVARRALESSRSAERSSGRDLTGHRRRPAGKTPRGSKAKN
jgi:hypothetical protein